MVDQPKCQANNKFSRKLFPHQELQGIEYFIKAT